MLYKIYNTRRKSVYVKLLVYKGAGKHTLNNKVITEVPYLAELVKFLNIPNYTLKIYSNGGGISATLDAAALAISKFVTESGIISRELLKQINPTALKSDPRKVWQKQPEGRGARTKRQKSYR